jgi:hypothetical protein
MKAALLLLLAPAQAGAFSLSFPVDCTLTESCFIQQYTDRDPTPAARDFNCGPLSYDGHKGTDFALPALSDMERGVSVLAAASGTVRATRDGMVDIAANAPNAPDITDRDCGNAVVITHEDGWETQYCHMKLGSIAVQQGETIAAGIRLGDIGLSGNTEFPHLHLSLRKNGAVVDPFSPNATETCGEAAPSLWSPALPFQPGGLIEIGLTQEVPSFDDVKSGRARNEALPLLAPALVLWAHVFGTRPADEILFSLTGPDGEVLRETVAMTKIQARAMRAIGKRLRAPNWPPGPYNATVTYMRNGEALSQKTRVITLLP